MLVYRKKINIKMQNVAVGIIIKEGKILICQRCKSRNYGLKWEFPGGKLEAGETYEQCLVRELHEELGINAEVGELLCSQTNEYDSGIFHVRYYLVRSFSGEVKNKNMYEQIKFEFPQNLLKYDILSGNLSVCKILENTELEKLERSSGGVVLRKDINGVHEVLLVLLTAHNEWGFPKGHIDSGETSIQAALREVQEETGVIAAVITQLPDSTYTYSSKQRFIPKRVTWFLMHYSDSGVQTHAHEISDIRWSKFPEALETLSFQNDKDILIGAMEYLQRNDL